MRRLQRPSKFTTSKPTHCHRLTRAPKRQLQVGRPPVSHSLLASPSQGKHCVSAHHSCWRLCRCCPKLAQMIVRLITERTPGKRSDVSATILRASLYLAPRSLVLPCDSVHSFSRILLKLRLFSSRGQHPKTKNPNWLRKTPLVTNQSTPCRINGRFQEGRLWQREKRLHPGFRHFATDRRRLGTSGRHFQAGSPWWHPLGPAWPIKQPNGATFGSGK